MWGRVTLRARVWVEIAPPLGRRCSPASPSVRGCGLKFRLSAVSGRLDTVTLRAWVWVEILLGGEPVLVGLVTLRARVWVEIC